MTINNFRMRYREEVEGNGTKITINRHFGKQTMERRQEEHIHVIRCSNLRCFNTKKIGKRHLRPRCRLLRKEVTKSPLREKHMENIGFRRFCKV